MYKIVKTVELFSKLETLAESWLRWTNKRPRCLTLAGVQSIRYVWQKEEQSQTCLRQIGKRVDSKAHENWTTTWTRCIITMGKRHAVAKIPVKTVSMVQEITTILKARYWDSIWSSPFQRIHTSSKSQSVKSVGRIKQIYLMPINKVDYLKV